MPERAIRNDRRNSIVISERLLRSRSLAFARYARPVGGGAVKSVTCDEHIGESVSCSVLPVGLQLERACLRIVIASFAYEARVFRSGSVVAVSRSDNDPVPGQTPPK